MRHTMGERIILALGNIQPSRSLQVRRVLYSMFADHLNHARPVLRSQTTSREVAVNVGRGAARVGLSQQVEGHVLGPQQVARDLLEIPEASWRRLCH